MANLNANLTGSVASSAPAVEQTNFGVPLYAANAANLGAGFDDERVRYYESAAEAAADADLSAVEEAAVAAAFAQTPRVSRVAVARIEPDVAQVVTWTFSGTIEVGDEIEITVDDQTATHVADSTVLNTEVGDLRTALDALLGAAYVVGGSGAIITVAAAVPGTPFTYSSSATPFDTGNIAVAEVLTTANVSISTELDAVLASEDDWYGLAIHSRVQLQIERAAGWVESNERLFIAQSNDATILAGTAANVLLTLGAESYRRTALIWHALDAEFADMAWMGMVLQADPDALATNWRYRTLAGVTLDDLTSTQIAQVRGDDGNVYEEFFGAAVTDPGVTVNGDPIDILISRDWVNARTLERVAQRLLDVAARNQKVPYTDQGVQSIVAIVQGVLEDGVAAGHFAVVLDENDRRLPIATAPRVAATPTADKQARRARITYVAVLAGAIELATFTGSVLVDL